MVYNTLGISWEYIKPTTTNQCKYDDQMRFWWWYNGIYHISNNSRNMDLKSGGYPAVWYVNRGNNDSEVDLGPKLPRNGGFSLEIWLYNGSRNQCV